MADLETRIHTWVDQRVEGVAPVTLDEIHERATTIPIDADPLPQPPRRYHPRPLAIAAAILLIAATIGATILLTDNTQENDVITETDQGLNRLATLIPDDVNGMAQLVDLEAIREQTTIARPDPGSSVDEGAAYFTAHFENSGGAVDLPADLDNSFGALGVEEVLTAFRADMGIELDQITAWADWDVAADQGTILTGSFDQAAVEAAAQSNDWPGEMTEHVHRGVTYYAWLDEYEQIIGEATVTNTLGQTRRIAVIDDIYIITRTTPHMEAAIDRVLDGSFADAPAGARAVLAALLDATRSEPPERAGVAVYSAEDSVTYLATAHRRLVANTPGRITAYAIALGIDERIPDEDIGDEADRLIELYATGPSPLAPPPGPNDPPFDELYDHSVVGRVITITRSDLGELIG